MNKFQLEALHRPTLWAPPGHISTPLYLESCVQSNATRHAHYSLRGVAQYTRMLCSETVAGFELDDGAKAAYCTDVLRLLFQRMTDDVR